MNLGRIVIWIGKSGTGTSAAKAAAGLGAAFVGTAVGAWFLGKKSAQKKKRKR